ncbi:MAG: CPBP family intramembrane metalloprotease [Pyrinomonadaceae bacterium]|nr:CPBP family intramembrane metalloprotease [Pyrinomonadaceae bacterium]MCX7640335.1 CPBP family intramembrane metalloprotease [Pyrinomonadaceae bacterium]MDW8304762.1 CPBP family intramembrane glutamic endopeptidase [Acidobacteriota bacterium]
MRERIDLPTPDNPPWGLPAAISVWLLSVFLIALMPYIFVVPYLNLKGVTKETAVIEEFIKNDPTAIILNLVAVFPAHIMTLVVCWFIVTGFGRYSFRQTLGWSLEKVNLSWAVIAVIAFNVIALLLLYLFPEPENDLIRILRSSSQALYLTAFLAISTAPIVEEVVYRGILYPVFQRKFGIAPAILFVTILFAIIHVPQYFPSYITISLIFTLSLLLTFVRAYSGSLLPCVLIHMFHNFIQVIALVVQDFMKTK